MVVAVEDRLAGPSPSKVPVVVEDDVEEGDRRGSLE